MKYMGGKSKIAKHVLPIILKDRTLNQWYVEPFCGGCGMMDKVTGNRIANDINKYIISLFIHVTKGWIPPDTITEEQYKYYHKGNGTYYERGFVGTTCSYAGKWFGGYARGKSEKGIERNYALEGKKSLLKQAVLLKDVIFKCQDYRQLYIPSNSIIYCDPPYANTTKYSMKFDYSVFYNWCREQKSKGHIIYISEYNMPNDFKCVWEKEVYNSLTKDTGAKKGVEKLYTL